MRIPKERVGTLIGPDGKVKETIEKKLPVELDVDGETGGVTISLTSNAQDPTTLFKAKELITAIGRGFSPERAFRLVTEDDTMLEVIDLREVVGKSQSDVRRLKGRVIGKAGKTRKTIEELTEASVSVFGHTISIIGNLEHVEAAKEAIRMLLRGSLHKTVYKFLHRKRRELKKRKMELWETPDEKLGL